MTQTTHTPDGFGIGDLSKDGSAPAAGAVTHTRGPVDLAVARWKPGTEPFGFAIEHPDKQHEGERMPLASVGVYTRLHPHGFFAPGELEQNGRLLAAAFNSYDRHFGPRAVEAAEADLLGEAIALLRDYFDRESENIRAPDDFYTKVGTLLSKLTP